MSIKTSAPRSALIIAAILVSPIVLRAQSPAPLDSNGGLIQLHLAQYEEAPGYTVVSTEYLPEETRRPVYVQDRAIVSDPHFESVHVRLGPRGELSLHVTLTPEGDTRLRDGTRGQEGRHMAFIVDSHLIAVSRIISPYTGALVGVSLGPYSLPNDAAAAMAEKIRARWPDEG